MNYYDGILRSVFSKLYNSWYQISTIKSILRINYIDRKETKIPSAVLQQTSTVVSPHIIDIRHIQQSFHNMLVLIILIQHFTSWICLKNTNIFPFLTYPDNEFAMINTSPNGRLGLVYSYHSWRIAYKIHLMRLIIYISIVWQHITRQWCNIFMYLEN